MVIIHLVNNISRGNSNTKSSVQKKQNISTNVYLDLVTEGRYTPQLYLWDVTGSDWYLARLSIRHNKGKNGGVHGALAGSILACFREEGNNVSFPQPSLSPKHPLPPYQAADDLYQLYIPQ